MSAGWGRWTVWLGVFAGVVNQLIHIECTYDSVVLWFCMLVGKQLELKKCLNATLLCLSDVCCF